MRSSNESAQVRRAAAGAAAWDAAAFASRTRWTHKLSRNAIGEIVDCAARLVLEGRTLRSVDPKDVAAPRLRLELHALTEELRSGSGVALLRGFPLEGATKEQLAARYWMLGTVFGFGVSQTRRGEYLGDVINLSDKQESLRPFQNGGGLIMHRDPVDIVGLLCVRHAKSGGRSRIVSAMKIHDLMLETRPDLLERLYEGFVYHRLEEDRIASSEFTGYRVPVFAPDAARQPSCFFIPGPIERAGRKGFPIDPRGREALDYFVALSERPDLYFDMDLEPGDVQFLNNRLILHGRTDYEDWPELERRRYMLRLWLMAPEWPALQPDQRFLEEDDRFGGGVRVAA